MPPKVERAAKIFRGYIASLPKDEAEVLTEEERKKAELVELHDMFFHNFKFVSDQLWIVSELVFAPHDCDIPLQNLYTTFDEMEKRLNIIEEKAKHVFELAGISEKEPESEEKAA